MAAIGAAATALDTSTVTAAAAVSAAAASAASPPRGPRSASTAVATHSQDLPTTEQGRRGTCIIAKKGRRQGAAEQQHHQQPSGATSARQRVAAHDFVAGCAAGVASTATGHPFDTVKIRSQMIGLSPRRCLQDLVRTEGVSALFKGLASPMLSVPLVNAIVFGSFGQAKAVLLAQRGQTQGSLTSAEACVAGAYAGLVNTAIVTPMELVKCRLQMQTAAHAVSSGTAPTTLRSELRASHAAVREILAADGWKGLWRGNVACASREVASYIGMFGTYELLKSTFGVREDGEETALQTVLFGGLAGVACWSLSYPQDVVKSHLQLQPLTTAPAWQRAQAYRHVRLPGPLPFRDGGIYEATRAIVSKHGLAGLWRGYSACALRAFPANGAGFLAYEATMKALAAEE
eukprot:SAG31_NODE_850_length_11521_cov_47.558396_9_plen_404_part_00